MSVGGLMDRSVAELLMKQMILLGDPLNAATVLTKDITDQDEAKQFRQGIAEVMSKVYGDLMLPIIRQYPDLDPDR